MFVKLARARGHTYAQIVESYRDASGEPRQRNSDLRRTCCGAVVEDCDACFFRCIARAGKTRRAKRRHFPRNRLGQLDHPHGVVAAPRKTTNE